MKLKELDIWFKDLSNIIFDLNISLNNARYLIKEEGTEAEQKIKNDAFFSHHLYQLKFIVIIQLCKLYGGNNERRSFRKLFNRLRNEGYDTAFEEVLNRNTTTGKGFKNKIDIIPALNQLEEKICEESRTIENVVNLRDKVYAHKDVDPELKDVYWSELERLIDLAGNCYNELYNNLFDADTIFNRTPSWEVRRIIESLGQRHDEIKRKRGKLQ